MTSRPSTAAPILAVLAVVLVTLGAYVGGYFWLGTWSDGYVAAKGITALSALEPAGFRKYRWDWQMTAFEPAGRIETFLRGMEIVITRELTEDEKRKPVRFE